MSSYRFDYVGIIARTANAPAVLSRADAQIIVDEHVGHFNLAVENVGLAHAVASFPDVARHLQWRIYGPQGKAIRDALVEHLNPTERLQDVGIGIVAELFADPDAAAKSFVEFMVTEEMLEVPEAEGPVEELIEVD